MIRSSGERSTSSSAWSNAAVRAWRGRFRRRAFGLGGAAEAGEAAVGAGHDFAAEHDRAALVAAAARALAGEAAARGERADQRHLAGFVLLEPEHAGQRLARPLRRGRSRACSARSADSEISAQLLVGRPFVRATARLRLRRPRRAARRAAARPAAARSSLRATRRSRRLRAWRGPTVRCRARATPRAPAARPECRACARARRPRRPAASASGWPMLEPASRCSASSSGSALISRPALSSRPRTGRGSEGALAIGPPQRCGGRAIGGIGGQPAARVLDFGLAHAVEGVDRPARIVDPQQVADRREQAGRRVARLQPSRSGTRPSAGAASPDSNSSIATSPLRPLRRASAWATKVISPSTAAATINSSFELAFSSRQERDELGGQRLDAACRVVAARARRSRPQPATGQPAAEPSGRDQLAAQGRAHGMDQRNCFGRRQIVEMDQALAKAVAAPTARQGSAPWRRPTPRRRYG